MLKQELQQLTDEAITKMIQEAEQQIIVHMRYLAKKGQHYVIYPRDILSNHLIAHLDKQGLKFYGRYGKNDKWHSIYPQKNCFDRYNDIMIGW